MKAAPIPMPPKPAQSSRVHGVSVVGDEARGVHQLSDPHLRVSSVLRSAADY